MKKGKWLIGFLVLAIGIAGAHYLSNKEEFLEVATMKSYKGSVVKTIELTGTINSDNIETISLQPNVEVVNTYVEENQLIKANTLLVELDSEDLLLSLQKSRLDLEQLQADLASLSNDNTDSVLFDNEVLKREDELAVLASDLERANYDLIRAEGLFEMGAMSEVERDVYITNIDKLNSQINKAEIDLEDIVVNNNSKQEKKNQDIAKLQKQIESKNLDIGNLNSKIKDSKIYSSISGYVTDFPVEKSKTTTNGDNIVIHGGDSFEFIANVSQENALLIKEGQKSEVKIDGMDKIYEAVVLFISKVASSDNGASEFPRVEIKIKILNPDEFIKFGYEGSAFVHVDSVEDQIIVKNECIKNEDGKNFIFLVENGITKKVYVQTGLSDGYITSILNGIDEGDIVVLNPPIDLIEGISVKGDEDETSS